MSADPKLDTLHVYYPDEDFIRATASKADQRSAALVGNGHMMTGYQDGFRAGAWWAHERLTAEEDAG